MTDAMPDAARVEAVLTFWFGERPEDWEPEEGKSALWWSGSPEVDADIRDRFGEDIERACAGELDGWAGTPRGALALVILLDQLTRNVHRGSGLAFAHDAHAQRVACAAIDRGDDRALRPVERVFLYMPLMHAEDVHLQRRCCELFGRLVAEAPADRRDGVARNLDFAERHRAVIERFGRFPHRNDRLGRATTAEEAAFLEEPGSRFG